MSGPIVEAKFKECMVCLSFESELEIGINIEFLITDAFVSVIL